MLTFVYMAAPLFVRIQHRKYKVNRQSKKIFHCQYIREIKAKDLLSSAHFSGSGCLGRGRKCQSRAIVEAEREIARKGEILDALLLML